MNKYSYYGPVLEFGVVVSENFSATTWAPSPKKAKNNIIFQFKKATGRMPSTKINLVNDIVLEEEGY